MLTPDDCVLWQTAEMIMKHNSSCSALPMACDPLLKEVVSDTFFFNFSQTCFIKQYLLINNHPDSSVSDLLFIFFILELWDSWGRTYAGRERHGQGSWSDVSRFHPSRGRDPGAGEDDLTISVMSSFIPRYVTLTACYCTITVTFYFWMYCVTGFYILTC